MTEVDKLKSVIHSLRSEANSETIKEAISAVNDIVDSHKIIPIRGSSFTEEDISKKFYRYMISIGAKPIDINTIQGEYMNSKTKILYRLYRQAYIDLGVTDV